MSFNQACRRTIRVNTLQAGSRRNGFSNQIQETFGGSGGFTAAGSFHFGRLADYRFADSDIAIAPEIGRDRNIS